MGQPPSAEIEIEASPETVRSILLDFQRHNEWNQHWTLTALDSSKQPANLKPGDKIKIVTKGMVLHPVVVENSASSFGWRASFGGIVSGTHMFHFTPSQRNPGGTTLTQKEDFGGLLSFLVGALFSPAKLQIDFEANNKDLKAVAEKD
ncbi:hypothetical protein K505DRAFT_260652 [Melanomma pulvis-pyrius CBS 109.77]|uniref:Polyketide cyclase/dehydrase n=1 Tax=Melanomma pulvis-pyrius CBS 109.77 TaxID=1314802 RepID=A0A6A6WQB7_9PLEO|nr:hypothetical protein K505DRAFT_260652 [Melanomma pulvis-pyrius CBS 109.77]